MLDCRHINPNLHLFRVKFEDIKVASDIFKPGTYVYTYDLKNAYHHIDIYEPQRTFLGFSWELYGRKEYFVYGSFPFGISVAGHVFTKVLRVVINFMRSKGHKVIMFLDDGIGGKETFSEAMESSVFVKQSLIDFGFLLANDKCNWLPKRKADWLGYSIDFELKKFLYRHGE